VSVRTAGHGWPRVALAGLALALLGLAAAIPAHAQAFSTADLEGTWRLYQVATPTGAGGAGSIRSYSGQVTFDGAATVTAGSLTDDLGTVYTVTGTLALTAAGLLQGTLDLDPPGALVVHEARLLASEFTLVGAATILDQVGLFTLVKLDATQTFTLQDDVANDGDGTGTYAYHELTPSDAELTAAVPGDANWSSGSITFHGDSGCTEADLVRADGTVRAVRTADPTSFG
jgi:hypothetical protein